MTRFTWGIVIGVLGLVAVSLALAFATPGREPTPDLGTPDGVVLAYALAFQRGDADAAWQLIADSAKGQTTKDRFASRMDNIKASYARVRLGIENSKVEGESAQVDLVRNGSGSRGPFGIGFDSGYTNRNTVRLAREGGQWRITSPPEPYVLDNVR